MKKSFILIFLGFTVFSIQAQFVNYQITKGFSPKNDIRTIVFDESEDLYVGTYAGIYKYENSIWLLCSPEEYYLESFLIDKDNRIWVSGWGSGVYRSDSNKQYYERIYDIPTSANILLRDKKEQIWAGLWAGGLFMYNASGWSKFVAEENSLADNSVMALAYDSSNNLWVGTYGGLSVYDSNQWTTYTKEESDLPDNIIYALAIGKNDRVWVGTCNGLVLINQQRKIEKVFNMSNSSIPNNVILCVAEDENGTIWIGSNRGLTSFDGKNWKTYTMANSNILENRIQELRVHNNKLYVGTSLGLSVIDLK